MHRRHTEILGWEGWVLGRSLHRCALEHLGRLHEAGGRGGLMVSCWEGRKQGLSRGKRPPDFRGAPDRGEIHRTRPCGPIPTVLCFSWLRRTLRNGTGERWASEGTGKAMVSGLVEQTKISFRAAVGW